jgi:hypothetical protein
VAIGGRDLRHMNSKTNDTRRFALRARGVRAFLALLVAAAGAGLWHTQTAAAAGAAVNITATVSGQSVTLTADVLGLPLLDTTGTVSFYESGSSTPLNGNGLALGGSVDDQTTSGSPFTLANVSPGTHTYYATYTPSFGVGLSIGFGPFSSSPTTVSVNDTSPPPTFTTQVTLSTNATNPVDTTQTVTITAAVARVPGSNGTPVGGTVAFNDIGSGLAVPVVTDTSTDNGQKVPLVNGVASISVQLPASPSPHEIVASYSGSSTDAASTTAAPLELTMKDASPVTTTTTVSVSPSTISAGDTVTITATLAISGNVPTPPTGDVTFSATSSTGGSVNLPSVPLGSAMDADGNLSPSASADVAVLEWPSWTAGSFTIVAAYSGNYPGSHNTANLSVGPARAATDLAYLGDSAVVYGHTATLSAKVTDRSQAGAPLAGRTVTFTVGTQTCSAVSGSNGIATCALVDQQDVGSPGVAVSVAQDLTTAAKSVQAPFSVTPQPTTLTTSYTAGTTQATLSATLLGDLGSGVASQTVTLTLGGETCTATTGADGKGSCTVPAITGTASATLDGSFAGSANGDYLASSAATKTVQLVVDTTLTYTGDTTATYGGPTTLSATLAQADGAPLAGRTVTFTLGSQTCTGTTDASGHVTCTIANVTQDAGTTAVVASYAGDAATNPASVSTPFTVQQAETTTVAAAPTVGATSTTLSATLTSGGTPLSGRTLTLTFGSSSCPATTGADGVGMCAVPTPSGASATFTASFAGETDYAHSSDSRTVTLLSPVAISYLGATGGEYSDIVLVAARVTGADGHGVPTGEPVTFTLGSESCTGRTFLGYAFCFLTVQEPAGASTVSVSYDGDSTHAASSLSVPFTVRHEEAVVHVLAAPALAGAPATLSATLLEDGLRPIAGRTVKLTLGSQSCSAVTAASGAASCSVTAPTALGPTSATASFAGDAYYDPDTDSTQTIVYAYAPGGGAFVIGDRSTSGTVTFWGSQWAKQNSLSGGSAPSSFKGFALHGVTQCGATWRTDPGNSSPPPSGPLPSYMAVLVTSGASKSGSTISGNTVSIVVVKTNAGYASNPGHAGTGTVVATVCGPSNDSRGGWDGWGDDGRGCGR